MSKRPEKFQIRIWGGRKYDYVRLEFAEPVQALYLSRDMAMMLMNGLAKAAMQHPVQWTGGVKIDRVWKDIEPQFIAYPKKMKTRKS